MFKSEILRLHAMDLTTLSQGTASATMRVPGTSGRREFRISTGIFFSMAGTTVAGTNIDFKQTLGLKNQRFAAFHLVARLAPKHKIHVEFIPLYYHQSAVLTTNLNFNGQSFLAGQTVNSSLNWSAWRAAIA